MHLFTIVSRISMYLSPAGTSRRPLSPSRSRMPARHRLPHPMPRPATSERPEHIQEHACLSSYECYTLGESIVCAAMEDEEDGGSRALMQ